MLIEVNNKEIKKYQISALLAIYVGDHRSLLDSPQKGPVMRKEFPYHDAIINYGHNRLFYQY